MSKYKEGEAGPVESWLYSSFAPVVGTWMHEKLGMTPNMITTFGMAVGMTMVYQLTQGNYKLAALLMVVRQSIDGLDGYVARKYNMQSKFGASYDKTADILIGISFAIAVITKLYKTVPSQMICVLLIGYLIMYYFCNKRHQCISSMNECADPAVRTVVLKYTNFLSAMENIIFFAAIFYCLSLK